MNPARFLGAGVTFFQRCKFTKHLLFTNQSVLGHDGAVFRVLKLPAGVAASRASLLHLLYRPREGHQRRRRCGIRVCLRAASIPGGTVVGSNSSSSSSSSSSGDVGASESRDDGGVGGGHEGEGLRQRWQPSEEVNAEREKTADSEASQHRVQCRRCHGEKRGVDQDPATGIG